MLSYELWNAVYAFEGVEKLRASCCRKLTHLGKNRRCEECNREYMPKSFEPCPMCGSEDSRMMKMNRKCTACGNIWKPETEHCPNCSSTLWTTKPKDDPNLRLVVVPRLEEFEKDLERIVVKAIADHPAWIWAKRVKGAGLTTIARIVARTDIYVLSTVSKFWSHAGFGLFPTGTMVDVAGSGKVDIGGTPQRRIKGRAITYDLQLQSTCVMLGGSLLRQESCFYQWYLQRKKRYQDLTPSHAHNRAFREMIKLFLSLLWERWRIEEGLPAPSPYVFEILKHDLGHKIEPEQMTDRPKVGESIK